jgi:3-oxoacyl-[acyl-carrier-protein] synthase III
MKEQRVRRSRILSIGSFLPEKVLSNFDLEKMVDTSDEWITERTGIKQRRIAASDQAASDLAYEASKIALQRSGIGAEEIDAIIVGTISGDMPFPSTACFLQDKLGASNAVAFDINAACSGFLFALYVADSFIKSGLKNKILIVGTEILSQITDWDDRTTCVLFGDGAGAAVIVPSHDESGILSAHIYSDGKMWDLINVPGGGSKNPASFESINQRLHYIKMKGNETFKVAVRTLEEVALRTLEQNNLNPSDLTLLIPHQANQRIIQATAERLKLPVEKVFMNLDKYGNTSAASIPIALDEAYQTGKIHEGDYILLEAFGGGLTWATALIKW